MNEETWEERFAEWFTVHDGKKRVIHGDYEKVVAFIRKELQRTRLETIAECEKAIPEEFNEVDQPTTYVPWNRCREETLENLASLKGT